MWISSIKYQFSGWGDIQITDPLSYALPHPLLVADGSVEPDENCTSLGRFTPTTHLCLTYRKRLDMCQVRKLTLKCKFSNKKNLKVLKLVWTVKNK